MLAPTKEAALCWLIRDEEVDTGDDVMASVAARSGLTRQVVARASWLTDGEALDVVPWPRWMEARLIEEVDMASLAVTESGVEAQDTGVEVVVCSAAPIAPTS